MVCSKFDSGAEAELRGGDLGQVPGSPPAYILQVPVDLPGVWTLLPLALIGPAIGQPEGGNRCAWVVCFHSQ